MAKVIQESYTGEVLIMDALVDTGVLDVVEFAGSIGVAQTSGLAGEKISVKTVGVFEMTADTASAFAVGDSVKYDNALGVIVPSAHADGDVVAGVAWSAKSATVAGTIQVKIG